MPFLDHLDKLLKERPKSPAEVVAKLSAAFELLASSAKSEKALEQVSKYLGQAKLLLFGDDEHEATRDVAIALAVEAARTDLMSRFVKHLYELDFEARKDVAAVYGALVRIKDADDRTPGATYVQAHPELLTFLFEGCARLMFKPTSMGQRAHPHACRGRVGPCAPGLAVGGLPRQSTH